MNGKRAGAVLAAAFLLASASSFAVEPTHLARRGADDGEEGRRERNRSGRDGVGEAHPGCSAAPARGPGAPRGPGDDEEHHRDQRAPATQGEQGAGPDVPPGGGGDPEARALFESKCSVCHPVRRPLGTNKDRAGWTATVTRMQKGNGCPLTDTGARWVTEYPSWE